jgi:DNA-directed RNA polymerase subunit beta'
MTRARSDSRGTGMTFAGPEEVRQAYDSGEVDLQAKVKVRMNGHLAETTVGRVLLYEIVPKEIPFEVINKVMNKKEVANLIDYCYRSCGDKATVILADRLKDTGFRYATVSGASIAINNMVIPSGKKDIVAKADKDVLEVQKQYMDGLITDGERYNKVIDIWAQATEKVAAEMLSPSAPRRSSWPTVGNAASRASTPST